MPEVFKSVGEFPPPRSPVTRMPINPIDRSTIISIYPKLIHEKKETIEPGIFDISPGRLDNPGILVVGSSSWWSYSGDKKPSFLDNLRPTETVAPSSSTVSSAKVTFNEDVEVKKPHFPAWLVRKNEILREYDNLESNVPVNHPEYWNLRIPDGISRID